MAERIAVIGAGIIGLTTSLRLQQAGFAVDVIAQALPVQTTSAVAAAFWYPYKVAPAARTLPWAERTYQIYCRQIASGTPGLRLATVHEFFRHEFTPPAWANLVQDFRHLNSTELPPPFESGVGFSAPLVDTSIYLPHLQRTLETLNINIAVQTLASVEPLLDAYEVVVNCSGVGARALVQDEAVYPIRGQVQRVAAPPAQSKILFYQEGEVASYVVPRTTDCVLGGTAEANDWETMPRAATAQSIRQRCAALDPAVGELGKIADAVGLRPGRREVRLEAEARLGGKLLLHNYGHGGAGFTLGWACAEEVLELLLNADAPPDKTHIPPPASPAS